MAMYDWDQLREAYVTGDDTVTLESMSRQQRAPSLIQLKRKSVKETWPELRQEFRNMAVSRVVRIAESQDAVQDVGNAIKLMPDAAEIISRHIRFARALQSIGAKALQGLDPSALSPKDILAFLDAGIKIELLATGKATARFEVGAVDVRALSDTQLERLAAGENVEQVLDVKAA